MTVRDILGGGLELFGVRRDTDTADGANGSAQRLLFNSRGKLKVATVPGDYDLVPGSITSATGTVALDVSTASSVFVNVFGTFAGVNFVFEGTVDGTNWFLVNAARTAGSAVESAITGISATPTYGWRVNVVGFVLFRIRATAWTSGAMNVRVQPSAASIEPAPVNQVTSITANTSVPTNSNIVTAATTNGAVLGASAQTLWELTVFNATAATIYVKLYNKSTAPTVGTDVPVMTIPVAAGAFAGYEFGRLGKRFTSGIGIAVTGAAAATDTTAVAAGAQINLSRL